jgi:hypothetical protein
MAKGKSLKRREASGIFEYYDELPGSKDFSVANVLVMAHKAAMTSAAGDDPILLRLDRRDPIRQRQVMFPTLPRGTETMATLL